MKINNFLRLLTFFYYRIPKLTLGLLSNFFYFSPLMILWKWMGSPINSFIDFFIGSPLHTAVFCGDDDQILLYLEAGANINAKDMWGTTPLHVAAKNGNLDIMSLLVSNGANVHAKNLWGKTAFDLLNEEDVERLLKEEASEKTSQ